MTQGEGERSALLAVRNLEVVYGGVIRVLRGVSLDVADGTVVALLGANGAGKTTLLRAVSGLLAVHNGRIVRGNITFKGDSIVGESTPSIVRGGIAQVMEGRRIFAELSVDENLKAGAFTRRNRAEINTNHERVIDMFPVLRERLRSVAGYLSGGEQQMLAIGRALMAQPQLLLLDEPSLGLAPLIQEQIRDTVAKIAADGVSVLLVEQNAMMALSIAHKGYVIENGQVVKEGPGQELLGDEQIREAYLGIGEAGHRSFKDMKSYRRRRQWVP